MSYQFVHMETHAMSVSKVRVKHENALAAQGVAFDRCLSVADICAEAARLPGHHPHVIEPQAPIVVFGISPDEVPELLDTLIDEANAKIRAAKAALPRGSRAGGTRAIRVDTHTMASIVTSYAVAWKSDYETERSMDNPGERERLENWVAMSVRQLETHAAETGMRLVSVVMHTDEGFPHLHGYFIAESERMDVKAVHPGIAAQNAVTPIAGETSSETKERGRTAYVQAMSEFQDKWHRNVSQHFGMARIGPARRRLSRLEWRVEKKEALARLVEVETQQQKLAIAETERAEAERVTEWLMDDCVDVGSRTRSAESYLADLQGRIESVENDLSAKLAKLAAATELIAEAAPEAVAVKVELKEVSLKLSSEKLLLENVEGVRGKLEPVLNLMRNERCA